MTPEQARIVVLESELVQAYHTIHFLDRCLRGVDNCKYGYPEQTQGRLADIRALVEIPAGCHHSRHRPTCAACQDHLRRHRFLAEAEDVLALKGGSK